MYQISSEERTILQAAIAVLLNIRDSHDDPNYRREEAGRAVLGITITLQAESEPR